MTKDDLKKLERYLRKQFSNDKITVRPRVKKVDSAEVYIADEFVGVLSEDKEDGETSYYFEMAILEMDLEG